MTCRFCNDNVTDRNVAVFNCGHSFHLSCVLSQPYSSLCAECDMPPTNLPDMGLDRSVAISSNAISKIQQRQLKGVTKRTLLQKFGNLITPLTPSLDCFSDHLYHNKRLSFIASVGFSPTDAVHERIKWSKISSTYDTADILEFGFKWVHMIEMGITPDEVHLFSWQQQQKKLELTAQKLLQTNISLSELAQMKYTTHQLLELGFDWNVMTLLGANVDSWRMFNFSLEEIKTYWNPSLTDLVSGGFYDRNRIKDAGWDMAEVMETLPNMTERSAGRVMRLAF